MIALFQRQKRKNIAVSSHLSARDLITGWLVVFIFLSALYYITWRISVINWHYFWIAVPLFSAELFTIIQNLGIHYTLYPRPAPTVNSNQISSLRPLFIFIPTVNEGVTVLEPTIKGVVAAAEQYLAVHPTGVVTIVVCNDGYAAGLSSWKDIDNLAKKHNVRCITRPHNTGAKAGNIEYARQEVGAHGDGLIAVFDADQIPDPHFFLEVVPQLGDPTIGWVQTPQSYRNLEEPVARWSHDQEMVFYSVVCPGKSYQNASFICGTNFVMRADALEAIGGFPQDTVTEDIAASIMLHQRGWRGIYVGKVLAHGLGPIDIDAYLTQQRRWASGTLSLFFRYWRILLLPRRSRLTTAQRIQYALSSTHYFCGLCTLTFLLAPMIFFFFGISGISVSHLTTFLQHFIPYLIISRLGYLHMMLYTPEIRSSIMSVGSFPSVLSALVEMLFRRKAKFKVTPKSRSRLTNNLWQLRWHICSIVVSFISIPFVFLHHQSLPNLVINGTLLLYIVSLITGFIYLGALDSSYKKRSYMISDADGHDPSPHPSPSNSMSPP